MGNFIIKTGDSLLVTIDLAIVPGLALPLPLVGSGTDVLVDGEPVCLPGDIEQLAELAGPLIYTAPPFVVPGTGMLLLGQPDVTVLTLSDGSPIVIEGQFSATFAVVTPANDGDVPDPVPVYAGSAEFITTNVTVTAS
jgi:hypothetical protein